MLCGGRTTIWSSPFLLRLASPLDSMLPTYRKAGKPLHPSKSWLRSSEVAAQVQV